VEATQTEAGTGPAPWLTRMVQHTLWVFTWLFLVLPYRRAAKGAPACDGRRLLFVANHVSLLDTPMLGAHLRTHLPVRVLGDAGTWRRNWVRRLVSARVGFFIDRGRPTKELIRRLREFGACGSHYALIVFPEGHRGDGVHVQECQPGIYHVARAAKLPMVPVFIENMQLVSSKTVPFRPLRGLRKVVLHFGAEIAPEEYLAVPRAEFCRMVQTRIQALAPRS
jgi:1-acyl-sn-glycerol-3-phosphate acyltransferase